MMELDESTFEQIHAYLRGEGTPEERAEFELKIQTHAVLATEVETQRRIQSGLKILANKQRFEEIHAALKASGELPIIEKTERDVISFSPKKSGWKSWAIAASLLLVSGVSWYVFLQTKEITSTTTLADRKEVRKDTSSIQIESKKTALAAETKKKSQSDEEPSLNRLFVQNFEKKPSLPASPFSQEKMGMNPGILQLWETETAAFFKGIDLLDKGEVNAARTIFEKIEQSRFDELRPYGEWYTTLALLKLSNKELAVEKLTKISLSEGHLYQLRAQKLLKQLQGDVQ